MKLATLCLVVFVPVSAVAQTTAVSKPALPALSPRDAGEVLQLLGSSELKGVDVPEAYRLMALLSQIAQQPLQHDRQPQPEIEKALSEREKEHAPK